MKHAYFQTTITYTNPSGSKLIRIITQKKEISSDRKTLEKNADFSVISVNAQ
jgi:hypothetical protein